MIFLRDIINTNDIISNKEKIIAIHNLTTPKNIHQMGSYHGVSWFYTLFIKNHSSNWTPSTDYIGKGKITRSEESKISLGQIKEKLCTCLGVLPNFKFYFHIAYDICIV